MMYKLYKTNPELKEANAAFYTDEQGRVISFIFNENNPDYIAYLAWLNEGNVPEPTEETK